MARSDEVLRQCERLGITIVPYGKAFRLIGPGVDVKVADLDVVHMPKDLLPVTDVPTWGPRR